MHLGSSHGAHSALSLRAQSGTSASGTITACCVATGHQSRQDVRRRLRGQQFSWGWKGAVEVVVIVARSKAVDNVVLRVLEKASASEDTTHLYRPPSGYPHIVGRTGKNLDARTRPIISTLFKGLFHTRFERAMKHALPSLPLGHTTTYYKLPTEFDTSLASRA